MGVLYLSTSHHPQTPATNPLTIQPHELNNIGSVEGGKKVDGCVAADGGRRMRRGRT